MPVKNTHIPGNSYRELVRFNGRGEGGIHASGEVGKVCVVVYNWQGQGCWKTLHLYTQGLGGHKGEKILKGQTRNEA